MKIFVFVAIAILLSSFTLPNPLHKPDKAAYAKEAKVSYVTQASTVKAVEEVINVELSERYQHSFVDAFEISIAVDAIPKVPHLKYGRYEAAARKMVGSFPNVNSPPLLRV